LKNAPGEDFSTGRIKNMLYSRRSSAKEIIMFKRELQVKMVKPKKGEAVNPEDVESGSNDVSSSMMWYTIDKGIKRIGTTVCAFVVLDTVRKVLIELASHAHE
jgi:hypothetical protein